MDSSSTNNNSLKKGKVSTSQFELDSTGFHGMETSLTTNQAIDNSTYNSIVKRVKKVLENTGWHTSLTIQANGFVEILSLFSLSLGSNQIADAVVLSDTIHDNQYDFSGAIDNWVALQ